VLLCEEAGWADNQTQKGKRVSTAVVECQECGFDDRELYVVVIAKTDTEIEGVI